VQPLAASDVSTVVWIIGEGQQILGISWKDSWVLSNTWLNIFEIRSCAWFGLSRINAEDSWIQMAGTEGSLPAIQYLHAFRRGTSSQKRR